MLVQGQMCIRVSRWLHSKQKQRQTSWKMFKVLQITFCQCHSYSLGKLNKTKSSQAFHCKWIEMFICFLFREYPKNHKRPSETWQLVNVIFVGFLLGSLKCPLEQNFWIGRKIVWIAAEKSGKINQRHCRNTEHSQYSNLELYSRREKPLLYIQSNWD